MGSIRKQRPNDQASEGSGAELVRPATSYDVARLAGVSQSAVSRCFKPGASVSDKMRKRVMDAARHLDFQPNAIARGLITRRSGLIAVFVWGRVNFYYPEVLFQLTERFAAHGMRVLLFPVQSEADVDQVLNQVWQYQVDGVVSASHLSLDQYKQLERRNIPVVLFNRFFDGYSTDVVWCDLRSQIEEMTARLVALGHRDIGLVHGVEGNMVGLERMRAVTESLAKHTSVKMREVRGDFTYESGAAALQALIAEGGEPSAVVCANDMMALGAMDEARHILGLKVPEDLSVVGFDGIGMARFASYELTTIRQPIGRMADAAVSVLLGKIGNPELSNERRVFEGAPIEGATLGPVRQRKRGK